MDKPPESTKAGRKGTVEKLPPLNLSSPKAPEGSQPVKDKQIVAGQESQDSAVTLERIEKDDGEGGVFKGAWKAKELTPGEKETVIKGRGLILTEDKEGYEFMYDMLTGLRATVRLFRYDYPYAPSALRKTIAL